MTDQHKQRIPADVLEEAIRMTTALIDFLMPFLLALTPDERQKMLKMGDKTLGFVEKAYEFARNNPNLCPPYLNLDEFKLDLDNALGLRGLLNKIQQLATGVDDTMMVAGSEAYNAGLSFYSTSKDGVKQNVPGAKAVYDELRKRFHGNTKRDSK